MGKLLFVNTNRVNGIAAIVICVAMIALGIWLTLDGTYVAAIFVALGLLGIKFFLKMATQRTELYEQGFRSKNIFNGISGRYADLKSITRSAVRVNGVLNTDIFLTTNAGEKVIVHNEKFRKGDDKMELLMEQASGAMAETWAKNLERQTDVVWLMDGAKPLLKIRKDGVLVTDKSGTEIYVPFTQFQIKATHGLGVEILNANQKVLPTSTAVANFHVGLSLIAILANKRSMTATSSSH
ncbi:MAG TPA: hypothetical protein VLK33_11440 [Terriglobales bacterium]|nr:hypothetical protein [Terriglobales bacterium]